MPRTDAERRAREKYFDEKRVHMVLEVSKDQRKQFHDYCKPFGGFSTHVKNLLRADMRAHGVEPLDAKETYQPEK